MFEKVKHFRAGTLLFQIFVTQIRVNFIIIPKLELQIVTIKLNCAMAEYIRRGCCQSLMIIKLSLFIFGHNTFSRELVPVAGLCI